jgi:hypothetical protein
MGAARLAVAKTPDCAGGWPTSMAFVHMKNAGLTDNDKIDFSKTKTSLIASERIRRESRPSRDIYRQVHLVTYVEKSGRVIQAITVNEASSVECSESGVEVFVVSEHIGDRE